MEPVDRSTVHDGWELPASNSQLVPHRGETESHLRDQKGGGGPRRYQRNSQRSRHGFRLLSSKKTEKHVEQR